MSAGDVYVLWLSGTEIARFRRFFESDEADKLSGSSDVLCNDGRYLDNDSKPVARKIIEVAEGQNRGSFATESRLVMLIYQSERRN